MDLARSIGWIGAAAAVLAIGAAAPAGAEPAKAWDQQRVTQLAGELAAAAKQMRKAKRNEPPQPASLRERARARYLETLKGLEKSTQQLEGRLKAGDGYEATLPIAEKIRSQLRDAEEDGKKLMTTAQMMELYLPLEKILDEIGPYYFTPKTEAES
jgi:hypothetical protein